jgi:hypothetical protein
MLTVRRADIKPRRLVRTKRKGGPAPKRGLRTTLKRGEGDYFFGAEAGSALTVDRSVLTRHGLIKGCFLHTAGGGAARTDVAMEKINPEMTVRLFLSSFMTFFLCQPARYGLAMTKEMATSVPLHGRAMSRRLNDLRIRQTRESKGWNVRRSIPARLHSGSGRRIDRFAKRATFDRAPPIDRCDIST